MSKSQANFVEDTIHFRKIAAIIVVIHSADHNILGMYLHLGLFIDYVRAFLSAERLQPPRSK